MIKILKIKEWLLQKKRNQELLDDIFWKNFKNFSNKKTGRVYEIPKYDPNNASEDYYITVRG